VFVCFRNPIQMHQTHFTNYYILRRNYDKRLKSDWMTLNQLCSTEIAY